MLKIFTLYNPDLNRFYFECLLQMPYGCIRLDDKVDDDNITKSFQLKRVETIYKNNQTDDDKSAPREFKYSTTCDGSDENELSLYLTIGKSNIKIHSLNSGFLSTEKEEEIFNYCFDLDPTLSHEIYFDANSLSFSSEPVLISQSPDSTLLKLYFQINAQIENHPIPEELDQKTICQPLQGPNIDLLNDWLFCHNHGPCSDHAESFTIPPELNKPVILDRVEQIIFLLINRDLEYDDRKILFESTDNKDDSIYLEFIKNNIFAANCTNDSIHRHDLINETETETENNVDTTGNIPFTIAQQFLVQHQIFGKCCTNAEQEEEEKESNPIHSIVYHKKYFSGDKKQLTRYRMSFEVEWYRVEAKLLHSLAILLIESSHRLSRLESAFGADFRDFVNNDNTSQQEDDQHPTLFTALLHQYRFV